MTDKKFSTKAEEFKFKVAQIINCMSLENGSNTPDFVLSAFLWDCLQAFDAASEHKEWLKNSGQIKAYLTENEK